MLRPFLSGAENMLIAVWIGAAFAAGLVTRQFGLPSLVGFLAAGFGLKAAGFEADETLLTLSEIGVVLLLFTVGLKVRLQNVLRPDVWGTTLLHLVIVGGLVALTLNQFMSLQTAAVAILACSFVFSSTVAAAKMLEERRELRAFHGRMAIGILIIQDLIAVGILALAEGQGRLSLWSFAVLGIIALRPLFLRLLDWLGHGELLVLYGIVLALGVGGLAFEELGLSAELGALFMGTMLADHPKANELGDVLWGLREFLLVGFFLSIGLTALPTWELLGISLLLILTLPLKAGLLFGLLMLFGLRARTAFLAALSLASFSEFGLIVIGDAVQAGLVDPSWLVVAAITVSLSFALAAPVNQLAHPIYQRIGDWLEKLETRRRHPDDQPVSLGSAEVVVVGMGRVGTAAYDHLQAAGYAVVGLDSDPGKLQRHLAAGRKTVFADAEDPGFWHRLTVERVRVFMFALPDVESKVIATRQLRASGYQGMISATHAYPEECALIQAAGANVTYNNYVEAGAGFASHTCEELLK